MERVVYILGAGFSAPLGLPLVSNFLERARDQHILEKKGNASFDQVFEHIDRLARIKNTYTADLDNIEEILSILEIDALIGEPTLRDTFQDFIRSVIAYRTPTMRLEAQLTAGDWQWGLFGTDSNVRLYGYFVAALQRLRFGWTDGSVTMSRIVNADVSYDVVTANYDCILENACAFLNSTCKATTKVEFRMLPDEPDTSPTLAKLHGSASGGALVPPTWSKGSDPAIAPRWDLARRVLGRAQHIRFIGYSLPEGDSNVRYLLKSAALESRHLKSIDVVCLDPGNDVFARYQAFIKHRKFRFEAIDTISLLGYIGGPTDPPTEPWRMLEQAHKNVFGT
jgi:hypothetical protein